jgi:hypothetical protein
MSASRSSKRCRRRGGGEWQLIFDSHNAVIGSIEQRADGLWMALASGGREIAVCNTAQAAADLVREDAARK